MPTSCTPSPASAGTEFPCAGSSSEPAEELRHLVPSKIKHLHAHTVLGSKVFPEAWQRAEQAEPIRHQAHLLWKVSACSTRHFSIPETQLLACTVEFPWPSGRPYSATTLRQEGNKEHNVITRIFCREFKHERIVPDKSLKEI
ncbi:hypothetical protein Anapl_08687 [Anas platyrhynchos]|uniref:Uncharacterized protein n=1 Tax=Anas platyrhynchos TaxID=8839 RepID=R0JZ86_ANAPL|nr:hypothetical protein Anapl_08687 [Anas platyrhynchos]